MNERDAQGYPKVTVIVLNWNGKENSCECLESLRQLDYPNYETIVVDNASTDGSQEFLKQKFPEITLVENPVNLGFGGGLNVGIEKSITSEANYILCLNNDVVVDHKIILELVKIGELSHLIGGLCPKEYYYGDSKRINCAGGIINLIKGRVFGHGKLDDGHFDQVMETRLLSGPAMMLKLNAVLDVGLFDTSYFYGPEDQDIALRLMKKGYRLVFVPSAKLWHKRSGATGGKIAPVNIYFSVRNRIAFVKKHANKLEWILFVLFFGLFEFPFKLLKCLIFGKRAYIDAAIRGLIWHQNRNLLPPDPQLFELFFRDSTKRGAR